MNPLKEFPLVRRIAYRCIWITGLVLGAIQVYCSAMETASPGWLKGALAVIAYVSVATNYTADQNIDMGSATPEVDESL